MRNCAKETSTVCGRQRSGFRGRVGSAGRLSEEHNRVREINDDRRKHEGCFLNLQELDEFGRVREGLENLCETQERAKQGLRVWEGKLEASEVAEGAKRGSSTMRSSLRGSSGCVEYWTRLKVMSSTRGSRNEAKGIVAKA